MTRNTVMPEKVMLGEHRQTTILSAYHNWANTTRVGINLRRVMGFAVPSWQRGLVWTEAQKIRLLESAWRGLNIGTYTVNQSPGGLSQYDNLLIDGQQRMNALQEYFEDRLQVFGYRWSEITDTDRRGFLMSRHFSSYITKSDDERYLREYYDMMNFGGTPHREHERAAPPAEQTGDET